MVQQHGSVGAVGDEVFLKEIGRSVCPMLLVMRKGELMRKGFVFMHNTAIDDR